MGKKNIALVFDVDDTLYNQAEIFGRAYKKVFGSRLNISFEDLFIQSRRHSDDVFELSQQGKISMEDMYAYRLQKAFEDFSVQITRAEALEFQQHYAAYQQNLTLSPETEQLLEYCSGRAKLGIITNGPSQHQWRKIKTLGVERWINKDNIVVSGDVGVNKPERQIFDYAKEKMQLGDAECWYIGDSWVNDVGGASCAGWRTVWINRRGATQLDGYAPNVSVSDEAELFEFLRWLLADRKVSR